MHLEELQNLDKRLEKNATLLWKKHTDNFSDWIKKKVSLILIYHFIIKKTFFSKFIFNEFFVDTFSLNER
jgi:hypothetical protein